MFDNNIKRIGFCCKYLDSDHKTVKKSVKKDSSTSKENIENKASEKTVSKPVIDSDEKAS